MYKKSIDFINRNGFLLMFPVRNKEDPRSLWSLHFPNTPLRWEWSEDADDKVVKMWTLMKKLSHSSDVVYSKWYQGRATFFSKEVFRALLAMSLHSNQKSPIYYLNPHAQNIFEILIESSPLSTKEIKKIAGLQGKLNEPFYHKAMKSLFEKFLIVGFGEVEDGAFPSLAVGATKNIHEEIWNEALEQDLAVSADLIKKTFASGTQGYKFLNKMGIKV